MTISEFCAFSIISERQKEFTNYAKAAGEDLESDHEEEYFFRMWFEFLAGITTV